MRLCQEDGGYPLQAPSQSLRKERYPVRMGYDATPPPKRDTGAHERQLARLQAVIPRCPQLDCFVLQKLPDICCA